MTALWLPQRTIAPTPDEVAAYLRARGWTLEQSNQAWALYGRQVDGQACQVEVPQRAAAKDYPRVVGTLLDDLARLEGRAPGEVLRDVRAAAMDIVRLGIEGTDEATCPDTEVMGIVVKLDSSDPGRGGDAVVKAPIDGKLRSVRFHLDAEPYRDAIDAHKQRQVVHCTGELAREGGSLVLRNARDFSRVADSEHA